MNTTYKICNKKGPDNGPFIYKNKIDKSTVNIPTKPIAIPASAPSDLPYSNARPTPIACEVAPKAIP